MERLDSSENQGKRMEQSNASYYAAFVAFIAIILLVLYLIISHKVENSFKPNLNMPKKVNTTEVKSPKPRKLGVATTIGELKKLIEGYPDEMSFGFRNQPMQALYEVKWPAYEYDGTEYPAGAAVVFN